MIGRRRYAKTDATRCPVTAKVTEANGECLSVEATATLPSTTSAVAMGNATENMALPSGGEGEEGKRGNADAGGAPAVEAPQTVMTTTEYVNSIDGEALVGDFVRAAEDCLLYTSDAADE